MGNKPLPREWALPPSKGLDHAAVLDLVPDRSTPRDEELSRALKLGYLKVCRQDDILVDAYLESCLEQSRPSVLLYEDQDRSWAIRYRLPPLRGWITDQGIGTIWRCLAESEQPDGLHRQIISGNGGELTGLLPSKAEAIAFRIADVANDRELTRPHAP